MKGSLSCREEITRQHCQLMLLETRLVIASPLLGTSTNSQPSLHSSRLQGYLSKKRHHIH